MLNPTVNALRELSVVELSFYLMVRFVSVAAEPFSTLRTGYAKHIILNPTPRRTCFLEERFMTENFSRYETADYLETEEDIRLYLEACQEEGSPALVAAALGDIAKSRSMTQLAKQTGMTRAGLYKALSADGNPSFATISNVAKALGLKVTVHPE